jgi:hypothetical protein
MRRITTNIRASTGKRLKRSNMMLLAETKLATAQSAELSETWSFEQRAIWSSVQLRCDRRNYSTELS